MPRSTTSGKSAWLLAALLALAGCAGDVRADGASSGPRTADPKAEALASKLRDYVTATYEVDAARTEATLERLRAAREALAQAMRDAGLAPAEGGLTGGVVANLREYFRDHGDLLFVPLGGASGILLAHVCERRDMAGREILGRAASYKLVAFDRVLIEDEASYRSARAGGPPVRPVARTQRGTIYVDLALARRIARDVVIPRAKGAGALEARARVGPLAPPEEKDLLRHRALEAEIRTSEAAVAAAIAREEELKVACLLACSPREEGHVALDPAKAAAVERSATLLAVAAGEPRYQLASALAAAIAAPGTPEGKGSAAALDALSGKPLDRCTPAELRAAAEAALGGER